MNSRVSPRRIDPNAPPPPELTTVVDVLRWRGAFQPDAKAFTFLVDGEDQEENLTFGELDRRCSRLGSVLLEHASPGDRVVILQEPGIDYIVSLYACMYGGLVAVPVYPPDFSRLQATLPRLQAITEDAEARIVLGSEGTLGASNSPFWSLPSSKCLTIESLGGPQERVSSDLGICSTASKGCAVEDRRDRVGSQVTRQKVALLQYTSGSTGTPRGVALTHGNLLANLRAGFDYWDVPDAVGVLWIPPYHDMGLIGGILLPAYGGRQSVLMSPRSFLQNPVRFLRAFHKYRGTTTGSPNFGYEICVRKIAEADCKGLDLSSWQVATSGAEPIRVSTMKRFAEKFSRFGFNPQALTPAYGMAESTVLISGKRKGEAPRFRCFDGASMHKGIARCCDSPLEAAKSSLSSDTQAHDGLTPSVVWLASCGKVIPSSEVAIVDPQTCQELPENRVGEIWVRGPSIAAGYWNKPEATNESFNIPLDTRPGRGFLRTGDLGFIDQGELYVNGRLKELIIIGGRNYHPHDLEQVVHDFSPAFRPDCGVAFSIESDNEERLVIVHEVLRPQKWDLDDLMAGIRKSLAETHQLAVQAIVLVPSGTLPKTSSGKLQRRLCRELYLNNQLRVLSRWHADDARQPASMMLHRGPQTETEKLVAQIWEEILELQSLGLDDDFLRLGGESLTITQMLYQIKDRLGVEISLGDLFENSTVESFARLVVTRTKSVSSAVHGSGTEDRPDQRASIIPLSRSQRRFWMLHQLDQTGAFSLVPFSLRIQTSPTEDGLLERIRWGLAEMVRKHSALRTRFFAVDGTPQQEVIDLPDSSVEVEVIDLRRLDATRRREGVESAKAAELHRRFDLGSPPLVRAKWIRVTNEESILLMVLPHIVCDGWSIHRLVNDLAALVSCSPNSQGEVSAKRNFDIHRHFTDYALWEQTESVGRNWETKVAYWKERLAGVPTVLNLATDFDRGHGTEETLAAQEVRTVLPTRLCQGLQGLCEQLRVTEFMVHLRLWQLLLARYSNTNDLLVGVPFANRGHPEWDSLVGCFMNTVAMRGRLDLGRSFADSMAQARDEVIADLSHAEVPFEMVLDAVPGARQTDRLPLLQNLLIFQPRASFSNTFGTGKLLEVEADYSSLSAFDLSLVVEHHAGTVLRIVFPPNLFYRSTVKRMLDTYLGMLEVVICDPNVALQDLPIPSIDEQRLIENWNQTDRPLPVVASAYELFAQRAKLHPQRTALSDNDATWTYGELLQVVDQLAKYFQRRGITADDRVGLHVSRTRWMVGSILALWKLKASYVPLDPNYPANRLQGMIDDCQMGFVVSEPALRDELKGFAGEIILLQGQVGCSDEEGSDKDEGEDGDGGDLQRLPAQGDSILQERLAYVIYTSGSTGKPKGVMVRQRGVINMLRSFANEPGFRKTDCLLALTTISFDISVLELFLPLTTGGRVVIAPSGIAEEPQVVSELIARHGVTMIQGTPSTFRLLLATGWEPDPSLTILCGGEPVTADLAARLKQHGSEVWNVYGPTETTVWSTVHRIDESTADISIGHPIENTRLKVLDQQRRLVPIGVPGELWIGGEGVAAGYWNRPDLTSERFVDFSTEPGGRSIYYRTGDMVRWKADGSLQFLSRADRQVKVRGHRVELGDVEVALQRHALVAEAAVVKHEQASGASLIAFCSLNPGTITARQGSPHESITDSGALNALAAELREYLREELPEYMVPSRLTILEQLPHTPAGKLDYRALPVTGITIDHTPFVAPRTPLEYQIAEVWQQVLQRGSIGVHDNFFDLGGHSLMAAQVFARMRDQFHLDMPLRELYRRPTVAEIAEWVVSQQMELAGDEEVARLLTEVEQMSDADALLALDQKMEPME